ncbi:MAG: hypothetical protein MUE35_14320 [Hydrogenophaga sp.]|jgi:hypothetical protein|nr:hypothetical protein [Hydrogenophaga sp.]
MTARRTMRRRLLALEGGNDDTGQPAYVVVGYFDASVPEPGETPPPDPDPDGLVTVVRVPGVAEPVRRQPGETDEALFMRAARAWPQFGRGEGIPVLHVRSEPAAPTVH